MSFTFGLSLLFQVSQAIVFWGPKPESRVGLETGKFPVCGTSVNKENLKGHLGRVHPKRPGSVAERQPVIKSVSVFKSHRKRNFAILGLLALVVIGVVAAAASYDRGIHWHPNLSVILNGSPYTVPADIGIASNLWKDHSLDQYGEGMAPLHTHDTSGLIHEEARTSHYDFTLHEFLAIWGQPSDGSAIDGHPVTSLTVDGVQQASPTGNVVLKDGQKIIMTLSP